MCDDISSSDDLRSRADGDGIQLDPIDIRVLAVMAEKEALTPDSYPLSLNALTNGCNQLTSRDPVMSLSEAEVQDALDRLIQKKLAAEVRQAGARVVKFEHRMRIQWTLEQDKLAALAVLMLRGPQTAAEIRVRAGRMQEFSSITGVENALQFLIDKFPPLVVKLPRAAGAKEMRYTHTFSGSELTQPSQGSVAQQDKITSDSTPERVARLESEIEALRTELQQLKDEFAQFRKQFD
ncbi:MAG: YceH family protein [Burkholderiaceae bacterium]